MLTDDDIRALYLEWIEDYCNVLFDHDALPTGVEMALKQLVDTDPREYRIASEKISDLSISYGSSDGNIPPFILNLLYPYIRPHLVGNKQKRPYIGGR